MIEIRWTHQTLLWGPSRESWPCHQGDGRQTDSRHDCPVSWCFVAVGMRVQRYQRGENEQERMCDHRLPHCKWGVWSWRTRLQATHGWHITSGYPFTVKPSCEISLMFPKSQSSTRLHSLIPRPCGRRETWPGYKANVCTMLDQHQVPFSADHCSWYQLNSSVPHYWESPASTVGNKRRELVGGLSQTKHKSHKWL